MNASEIRERLEDFIRKRPIVLVATGLSISMGLPGMTELLNYLKNQITLDKGTQIFQDWEGALAEIEACGLEEGLQKKQVSEELLSVIVSETRSIVGARDTALREALFCANPKAFPFARLIKHLIDSLPDTYPILDIITPNYDHIVEFACDHEKIHCATGFSGTDVRSFRREVLTDCNLCVPISLSEKGREKTEFRPIRQVRLLKPHGSLKWQKVGDSFYSCDYPLQDSSPVLITPGLTKYKTSLTDHVMNAHREIANQRLEKATALLIIGYGFNDDHLQTVLKDRLVNGLDCLVLTHSLSTNGKTILQKATETMAIESRDKKGSLFHFRGNTFQTDENLWNLQDFVDLIIGN